MPNAMRSVDPRRVGGLECTAWVTYYRREWLKFLRAAVGLTRHTFALPWSATLRGAWLVLRANQLWAPYPDNDPDGARRCMEGFYRLVAAPPGGRAARARHAPLRPLGAGGLPPRERARARGARGARALLRGPARRGPPLLSAHQRWRRGRSLVTWKSSKATFRSVLVPARLKANRPTFTFFSAAPVV
jgi:hypothetical protein